MTTIQSSPFKPSDYPGPSSLVDSMTPGERWAYQQELLKAEPKASPVVQELLDNLGGFGLGLASSFTGYTGASLGIAMNAGADGDISYTTPLNLGDEVPEDPNSIAWITGLSKKNSARGVAKDLIDNDVSFDDYAYILSATTYGDYQDRMLKVKLASTEAREAGSFLGKTVGFASDTATLILMGMASEPLFFAGMGGKMAATAQTIGNARALPRWGQMVSMSNEAARAASVVSKGGLAKRGVAVALAEESAIQLAKNAIDPTYRPDIGSVLFDYTLSGAVMGAVGGFAGRYLVKEEIEKLAKMHYQTVRAGNVEIGFHNPLSFVSYSQADSTLLAKTAKSPFSSVTQLAESSWTKYTGKSGENAITRILNEIDVLGGSSSRELTEELTASIVKHYKNGARGVALERKVVDELEGLVPDDVLTKMQESRVPKKKGYTITPGTGFDEIEDLLNQSRVVDDLFKHFEDMSTPFYGAEGEAGAAETASLILQTANEVRKRGGRVTREQFETVITDLQDLLRNPPMRQNSKGKMVLDSKVRLAKLADIINSRVPTPVNKVPIPTELVGKFKAKATQILPPTPPVPPKPTRVKAGARVESTESALEKIGNSKSAFAPLAKKLNAVLDKSSRLVPIYRGEYDPRYGGVYVSPFDEIIVYKSADGTYRHGTVIHEVLHGGTVTKMREDAADLGVTIYKRDLDEAKQIISAAEAKKIDNETVRICKLFVHYHTLKAAGKLPPINLATNEGFYIDYAGSNFFEFVTNIFEGPGVAAHFAKIKGIGTKTILGELLDIVKSIFKLTDTEDTLLDEIINETEALLKRERRSSIRTPGTPYPKAPMSGKYIGGLPVQAEFRLKPIFQADMSDDMKAWSKGSKIVDKAGNLRAMLHGTTSEFATFQRSRTGKLGSGIYFSSQEVKANLYADIENQTGRIIPVVLNIQKPFEINLDNEETFSFLYDKAFEYYMKDDKRIYLGGKGLREPSYYNLGFAPSSPNAALRRDPKGKFVHELIRADTGNAFLKSLGYDGIIHQSAVDSAADEITEALVFDSNQIKGYFNDTPTGSADIMGSVRPFGIGGTSSPTHAIIGGDLPTPVGGGVRSMGEQVPQLFAGKDTLPFGLAKFFNQAANVLLSNNPVARQMAWMMFNSRRAATTAGGIEVAQQHTIFERGTYEMAGFMQRTLMSYRNGYTRFALNRSAGDAISLMDGIRAAFGPGSKNMRKQFDSAVMEQLRTGRFDHVNDGVNATAKEMRNVLNEMHNTAAEAGVRGFQRGRLENYFPRLYQWDRIARLTRTVEGESAFAQLLEHALNTAAGNRQLMMPDGTTAALSDIPAAARALAGRLKRLATDSDLAPMLDIDQEMADALNAMLGPMAPTGSSRTPRGRPRIIMNETATINTTQDFLNNGSTALSLADLTSGDLNDVMKKYTTSVMGAVNERNLISEFNNVLRHYDIRTPKDESGVSQIVQVETFDEMLGLANRFGAENQDMGLLGEETIRSLRELLSAIRYEPLYRNSQDLNGLTRFGNRLMGVTLPLGYLATGGAFGLAQINETSRVIGTFGLSTALKQMPVLGEMVGNWKNMDEGTSNLASMMDQAFHPSGDRLRRHLYGEIEGDAAGQGMIMRGLNSAANFFSDITLLAPSTSFTQHLAGASALQHLYEVSKGATNRLDAATVRTLGLEPAQYEEVINWVGANGITRTGTDRLVDLADLTAPQMDLLRTFVDRTVRTRIQDMPTRGDFSKLAFTTLGRLFTQFRSFNLKGIDNFLYQNVSRARRGGGMRVGQEVVATMIFASMIQYARAWADEKSYRESGNTKKAKEIADKQLGIEGFLKGGLTGPSELFLPLFAVDASWGSAVSDDPIFSPYRYSGLQWYGIPAAAFGVRAFNAAKDIYGSTVAEGLGFEDRQRSITKKTVHNARLLLWGQNAPIIKQLLNMGEEELSREFRLMDEQPRRNSRYDGRN